MSITHLQVLLISNLWSKITLSVEFSLCYQYIFSRQCKSLHLKIWFFSILLWTISISLNDFIAFCLSQLVEFKNLSFRVKTLLMYCKLNIRLNSSFYRYIKMQIWCRFRSRFELCLVGLFEQFVSIIKSIYQKRSTFVYAYIFFFPVKRTASKSLIALNSF